MYNLLYEYSVFCNGNEHQKKNAIFIIYWIENFFFLQWKWLSMDKCNMYNLLDVDFFLQWKSVSRHKDQSCHLFLCISALNCMLIHMLDKGLSSTNDYSVMVIMKHWVIDCLYEFFPIYPVIICSTFAKLHDLQSLWMSFIVLVYGIVMRMCLGWISCLQQETLSPILGSKFFFSL